MERSGAGRCGEYGRTPGCAPAWWSRCAAGPQPARVIAEQSCEPACSELARRAKAGGGLTPPAGAPPPHPYAGGCTGTDGCEHDRCEAGPAAPIPDAVGGCDATGRPPIVAAQYDSFGTKYCWPCAPERGEGVGARGWGRGRGAGVGRTRRSAGVEGGEEGASESGESGGGRRERDQRPPRCIQAERRGSVAGDGGDGGSAAPPARCSRFRRRCTAAASRQRRRRGARRATERPGRIGAGAAGRRGVRRRRKRVHGSARNSREAARRGLDHGGGRPATARGAGGRPAASPMRRQPPPLGVRGGSKSHIARAGRGGAAGCKWWRETHMSDAPAARAVRDGCGSCSADCVCVGVAAAAAFGAVDGGAEAAS